MILRFCSGSVTPASRSRNRVGGVDEVERQLQLLEALARTCVRLVQAQQAVVDEDARQPVADRAVDEHRGDRRVDAAGQAADDAAVADLRRDARGRLVDERRHRPVAGAAADVEGEVAQDLGAAVGVRDLGVEQQRVEPRSGASMAATGALALVAATAKPGRRARRRSRRGSPRPAARRACPSNSRGAGRRRAVHQGVAELAMRSRPTRAAEHVGHQLHAVADAEHRHAEVEHRAGRSCGAPSSRHAPRPARQDDADWAACARDRVERRVERQNLASRPTARADGARSAA